MNRFSSLLMVFLLVSGCHREDDQMQAGPSMKYVDLNESEVRMGSTQRIDLDEDGTIDFSFKTLLIGDPVLKRDRLAFVAGSTVETYLLVIDNTETGKRLDKGDHIGFSPPSGYEWFQIAQVVMTEKIIPESNPIFWAGTWTDASHHFLPVQIRKNGAFYFGWIEVSMDTQGERMILHKAAISLEAGKDVRAGY